MNEEEKAKKEAADAAFEDSIRDLSDEEKTSKRTERESSGETPEQTAARLLAEQGGGKKKILVDQDRFNDRNDKAKLYEVFAPVIDKLKDDPEAIKKLLQTDEKGSLENRVAAMENERKGNQRKELQSAMTESIKRFGKGFSEDWSELEGQVEMLIRQGQPASEAMRRAYIAMHPEEASAEAARVATERANIEGQYPSGGGRRPNVIGDGAGDVKLTEREAKVASQLVGKDFGTGLVLIKDAKDYKRLLEKHSADLRARGFPMD